MNTAIKKLFIILLITIASAALADDAAAPAIDLTITVSSLDRAVQSGRGLPAAGTPAVLNGTVIERILIDGEKETFSGELVLASGEWVADDEITVSKCIILMNGPQFAETIPARRSRTVNPNEITLNSELLVYAVYLGYAETDEGLMAVLQAYSVRKL